MQKNTPSNHEITKNNTKKLFLEYDQEKIIKKWNLPHDEDYLYINFVGKKYRVNRLSGDVEELDTKGDFVREAGFSETLSIFDVLCYSRDDCFLTGKFCTVHSLKGVAYTAGPGRGMYDKYGEMVDKNNEIFTEFCENIGGKRIPGADISYEIKIYDFLPAIIRFWASDDEFPAEMKFYWDENILMYMHFETVFFIMGYVYSEMVKTSGNH